MKWRVVERDDVNNFCSDDGDDDDNYYNAI